MSVQNSSILESFTLQQPEVCEYNASPKMLVFAIIIYLLVEIVGNFLSFCMIIYEKFGSDSQKRTATNQLLSSICGMFIVFNVVFASTNLINKFIIQSKPYKSYHCGYSNSFPRVTAINI